MELSYKDLINNCVIDCAHDQLAVTCSVDTKDRGGVKKLLGLSAECKVYTAEAMKGEAKITGKACYKVIYIDRDNKTAGLDYFCDFSESIVGDIAPQDILNVCHSVVDVSGRIEDDVITLTAICDFVIKVIGKHSGKTIDVANEIYTNRELQETVELSPLKEDTFEVSVEEESGTSVDKVLYFGTTPLITAVTKSDVGALVEGVVQTEIVYLGENGVRGKSFGIPFSEEIEADNLADVKATIKNSRLVLSGDSANNVFEVEVFVTLSGYDVAVRDVELVVDAFSPEKQIEVTHDFLPCKRYVGSKTFDFPVSTEVEGDSLPDNATVLATPVLRVNIANALAGENEVTLEGLAVATILYMNEDRLDSVQVELPFSVTEKVDGITPTDTLTAKALITDFTATFMSGIITLRAMLKARVCIYKTYSLKWVSQVKEGEEKPRNNSGISIYYVNPADSIWDIAKAVNMSPEEVESTNPELTTPTNETRRVIVYRKRQTE